MAVKRNIEYVKRVKQAMEKEDSEKQLRDAEQKKRKENQMSEYEVKKTYAVNLKNKLEELAKNSGKKLSLNIEIIQIFSLINFSNFPQKKTDLPKFLRISIST